MEDEKKFLYTITKRYISFLPTIIKPIAENKTIKKHASLHDNDENIHPNVNGCSCYFFFFFLKAIDKLDAKNHFYINIALNIFMSRIYFKWLPDQPPIFIHNLILILIKFLVQLHKQKMVVFLSLTKLIPWRNIHMSLKFQLKEGFQIQSVLALRSIDSMFIAQCR